MSAAKKLKKAKSKKQAVKQAVKVVKMVPPPPLTQAELLKRLIATIPRPTSTLVPVPPPYVDDRGSIQPLVNLPGCSVLIITSKADSRRANHWHKESSHYCFVLKGGIEYYERPVGSTNAPTVQVFGPGQVFFTPSNVEHAMKFTANTEFLTISTDNARSQEEYEADLVRLATPLI